MLSISRRCRIAEESDLFAGRVEMNRASVLPGANHNIIAINQLAVYPKNQ